MSGVGQLNRTLAHRPTRPPLLKWTSPLTLQNLGVANDGFGQSVSIFADENAVPGGSVAVE